MKNLRFFYIHISSKIDSVTSNVGGDRGQRLLGGDKRQCPLGGDRKQSSLVVIKQINKIKVLSISSHVLKLEEIWEYVLFKEIYSIIFLCAKKNSRKISTIFTILKNCANKNFIIYIFASTVNNNNNWIHITN